MGKREKFGQIFIYFILVVWFGTEVLFSSTIENIFIWKADELNEIVALMLLILLLIQIVFFQKYSMSEIVIIALVTGVIVFATLNSNHNRMISTWIFIVAAKYINFEKIAKISYYVEFVMTLLVIYLFYSGILKENIVYRGYTVRHSLGFSHPNQLGIRIFLLVVCRTYIRKEKFNFIDWFIIIISALFVNKVANSQTSYYALLILAAIMLVHILVRKNERLLVNTSSIMIWMAVFANVMSVYLSVINVKNYALLKKIDLVLSRRFSECHRTLNYYGIKPFGQDINLIVNRSIIGKYYHFWLDNAYMTMILRYGILVYLIFSSLYILTMYILKIKGQHVLVGILCLYAIYGIMENNFFSMSQNLFLLLMAYPIYERMESVVGKRGLFPRIKISW